MKSMRNQNVAKTNNEIQNFEGRVAAKSEMYKLPAHYVGEYAEHDASLTLKLWNHFIIFGKAK